MNLFSMWFALSLRCVLVIPAQKTPMKYGLAHLARRRNSLLRYLLRRSLYVFSRRSHWSSNKDALRRDVGDKGVELFLELAVFAVNMP